MRIKDWMFGGSYESSPLADFGLMLLRGFLGSALAFGHGFGKLQNPERFLGSVGNLGLPFPTAFGWLVIAAEFFGGILLALGLLTRPAALLILCTMAVALTGVHFRDPFQKQELALLYGFGALVFLFAGAGRYGFDALIRGKGKR